MEKDKFLQSIGRIIAGGFYDYQEVRLSAMNRLRGIVRAKNEDIDLTMPEQKKGEKTYDTKYSDATIFPLLHEMKATKTINEKEYTYVVKLEDLFTQSHKLEKEWIRVMDEYIKTEAIWTEWLVNVKGISTILTSNLLKEFGYCETYKHISSVWKHCGLHLICPECTMEVTMEGDEEQKKRVIPVTVNNQGVCPVCSKRGIGACRKRGRSIDYNPRLKVLVWKIGDSFIKQRTPFYRAIYDNEKARQMQLLERNAVNAPQRLSHADSRARRKMEKQFLAHYWYVAHKIKELPISEPYVAAKLGHTGIVMPQWNEEQDLWVL